MQYCTFLILSVFAYLQAQVNAGPVAPKEFKETTPAPVKETNTTNADTETDFDNESSLDQEATSNNTSHVFNSNPEDATDPSATPNLDAFMRAFEAIDSKVYNEIETFLEKIVPKLPENNNPITNHLESAVFLFELYEKMKEPRDLNNSQEQHFLAEIENFLASNSFLLFNKPTAGRQEQFDDDLPSDQEGDEQNQEFELNDEITNENENENENEIEDEIENKPEKNEKSEKNETPKKNEKLEKAPKTIAAAA